MTAIILLPVHIYAQIDGSLLELKSQGNMLILNGQYYQAGVIYKSILDLDSTLLDISYQYAECNRHLLNYQNAEYWYKKVSLNDSNNTYTEAWFYWALAEKNNGKYQFAKEHFQFYNTISKKNNYKLKAKNEIASCEFALEHINDITHIEIEHLPAPVNTEYSEFNPVPLSSSELVFTRYQNVFKDTFESIFDQSYISDIMSSRISEQGWANPSTYSKHFQDNSDFVANICFNHNFRRAYASVCEDLDGHVGNCALYTSEYRNGKWGKLKRLNKEINIEGYSVTQPFFVETEEYNILYFASNRPGGHGNMDIWYVIIKENEYQTVTNLGSIINTKGSELTPTYDYDNQTLYFSSDWHQGFGGFDIFSSQGGLNSWTQPQNMGLPFNSGSNDLYYIFRPDKNEAWLSSNRLESFHRKNAENCCSDIYYISFEPKAEVQIEDSTPEIIVQLDSIERKIQQLLPLTLYFHNDIPNPRSTSPNTDKNYQELLVDYFKLEAKYKKEYSRGLKGDLSLRAEETIEQFFKDYVGHGFEDLEKLAALLKRELEQGKDIRLKIKGYASPLNTSDYNLNLSKRRIASLVNYLKEYEGGYFLPYFSSTASNGGSITIFENPLGDSQAADFVSDNPNDKRNSIYSRAAALERKIQIILYSSGNTLNQDVSNQEFPMLKWKSKKPILDSISQGERGVYILGFDNVGKSELQIKSIKSASPFISTQIKNNTIQPGESGSIYLLIQTEELKTGKHTFNLSIKTNMLEKVATISFHFTVY